MLDEQLREVRPAALVYARSILRHTADAEDAVQDAGFKALRAYGRYDPSRSFKAWFFRILKNCCLDRLRQRARENSNSDLIEVADPGLEVDRGHEVQWCLERLTTAHQEILRLRYFAEMTYAELANCLDIPQGTVMSRLHAARLSFANQLESKND